MFIDFRFKRQRKGWKKERGGREGERERDSEKENDQLPPICAPTKDQTSQPKYVP